MIREPTGRPADTAPARRRPAGRPSSWLVVALAVVALTLIAVDVARRGALTHLDSTISRWAKDLHLPAHGLTHDAIYLLTLFGQRGPVLLVSVSLVGYLAWRARSVEPAVRYLVALIVLTVVVYALKTGITRTAPSYRPGRSNPAESFPSGHLANAVLVWGVLAWSAVRTGAPRPLIRTLRVVQVIAPPAVFAGMTLLDYHWFSDFAAGACIGVAVLAVVGQPWLAVPARQLDGWLGDRLPERPAERSAQRSGRS